MKTLIIYGSPKKEGNSATLAKRFRQGLMENGALEIKEIWLNDLDIKPCQGCFRCAANASCYIDDDMRQVYPELGKADLFVFATPIYWWHMIAQMKLFFDRMTARLSGSDKLTDLTGKNVVLIVTYNYYECARPVIKMFEDFKGWIDVKLEVIDYCSLKEPVSNCEAKLDEAYQLGKTMAGCQK
ncbi:MAG: flavodoxin family protein [Firmicutes bacterium]|nr:flavodoxin family protein [Bacillota bacterium]